MPANHRSSVSQSRASSLLPALLLLLLFVLCTPSSAQVSLFPNFPESLRGIAQPGHGNVIHISARPPAAAAAAGGAAAAVHVSTNTTTTASTGLSWDYLMMVEVWPPAWLGESGNHNFDNSYFTIHGLWPNRNDGSWPEYCKNAPKFDRTQLSPIADRLQRYWTNFRDAEQFWEHEYTKHGTCMLESTRWSTPRQTFEVGLQLNTQHRLREWLKKAGVTPSNTRKYSWSVLDKALTAHLGGVKAVVQCNKKQQLEQVLVCYNESLKRIDCPPNQVSRRCSSNDLFVPEYKRK